MAMKTKAELRVINRKHRMLIVNCQKHPIHFKQRIGKPLAEATPYSYRASLETSEAYAVVRKNLIKAQTQLRRKGGHPEFQLVQGDEGC